MPDDFFTLESFAVLASAVAIVGVVVNTIRHVTGWGPRWFGLLISLTVAVVGAEVAGVFEGGFGLSKVVLVLLNGFLLYTMAFGVQNTLVNPLATRTPTSAQAEGRPKFGSRW